ncbi:MAG: DUF4142 domain-containing protein [Methylobacteriaceae bacterium]|nr:DUF4142 domain-containing protein [Methylobacteriaceae bacterium]
MDRRQFTAGLLLATAPFAITRTAVAQTPAPAGAIPAPQYFAMASKGGMFLEESARTGFEKTSNPAVKRFARAEVVEQVNLADRLRATGIGQSVYAAAPGAVPPGGVVGGLVGAPFAVAGAATGFAVDTTATILGAGAPPMTSEAQKAETLRQIQALPPGPEFDTVFVRAQLIGHTEALGIHGSYAQAGDDPELRRVARNALPLIRLHISQLHRMERMMGVPQG